MKSKPAGIRQPILEALRAAKGRWVSGGALSDSLGVSRMAVSKQIQTLRDNGFAIESARRKGHRLLWEPDVLTPEAVDPLLRNTRFNCGKTRLLASTPSTNDVALSLARAGVPEGTLVIAEEQTAGRGRRGRTWFGKPGDSLMFSVVLRPPLEPARCALLPLMAASAVRSGLIDLGFTGAGIKWPNDVLVGKKKLGGILCEMSSAFDQVEHAVVGMGLNINTPPEAFPGDIAEIACSLRGETGKSWKRARVLAAVLRHFDRYLGEAWGNKFDAVIQDWRAGSVTLGARVEATLPDGSRLQGVAEDLDGSGALVLRMDDGARRHLTGGEISLGRA